MRKPLHRVKIGYIIGEGGGNISFYPSNAFADQHGVARPLGTFQDNSARNRVDGINRAFDDTAGVKMNSNHPVRW